MKKIISAFVILWFAGWSSASAQMDTVRIQTSAICEQCKDRIEHDLSFEKGIRTAHLDLNSKVVTVVYNSKKTDAEKIREAIAEIGYDADSIKANPKSYQKLPSCCKKDSGMH